VAELHLGVDQDTVGLGAEGILGDDAATQAAGGAEVVQDSDRLARPSIVDRLPGSSSAARSSARSARL